MDTGWADLSVTEALQPALLTGSEHPNMPNDWEKIPAISSSLCTPKQSSAPTCLIRNSPEIKDFY